jgi:hypothetical protein
LNSLRPAFQRAVGHQIRLIIPYFIFVFFFFFFFFFLI